MLGLVVFASLFAASLQTNAYGRGEVHVSGSYKQEGEVHVSGGGATRVVDSGNSYNRPAHHDRYRPAHHAPAYPANHAPAHHGDVHVSGSYQQEGEVHVSGSGAVRVVDSGNTYHDAPTYPVPVHHAPYYAAPVHYAPGHYAPAHHGDVHVSGNYKQEGEVHVSGSGAVRVVDSGNTYHDAPVHHAPTYPVPVHHAPAYPAPVHHAPAYPAHDNVHVSGTAGSSRIVESGNAYQDSPVHHAPAYPARPAPAHDNVLVSGSYQQEAEVHVSGAGSVRVEDFQPSYTHAEPDYQPRVVIPTHLEQPIGAGPYEPAPQQPEVEPHVPEPAVYVPEEPVAVPYSQGDDVPEYVMPTPQYDEAHLPTVYDDEHYVPESHEIATVYES